MMTDDGCRFTLLNGGTGKEVKLAMEGLWLTGRVLSVGAHLIVVHTFRSAEAKPLEVVYAFGLPRDAALRRFKVVGEGFQVRSDLRPYQEAQEAYEQGISEGHLSSLARTYRDGRVNLSVGNIRPGEVVKVFLEVVAGVDLRDDGLRFRFPFTLAPGYHRGARAAEVEPGVGELELPEEEFGDLLLPRYMTDSAALHSVGFDLEISPGSEIAALASPSHAVRIAGLGTKGARVTLSREREVPDRDLVLDVQTSDAAVRCCGGPCRGAKARFTVAVPSKLFGRRGNTPKSVVFVLDRSGSMQGPPIEQAKKAVEACLGTLGERDEFGFVAFDNQVELFKPKLVPGTVENRDELRRFLSGMGGRGGTELGQGIQAAVNLAGGAQAELMVITDGQVAGTEDILGRVRAAGARLHCLGIGAASQDRFLTLLARETGGVSRFLTPRERVDLGALELFATIGAPVASEVEVHFGDLAGGQAVLTPPSIVYEGHPFVVMGQAAKPLRGGLRVTWGAKGAGGQLTVDVRGTTSQEAETVRLLQGARLITDLESALAGELPGRPSPARLGRENRRILKKLGELSREHGLASRAMALVAVVERPGDDASQVPTTRVVPVGMPQDVRLDSYFSQPLAAGMEGLFDSMRVGGPRAIRASLSGSAVHLVRSMDDEVRGVDDLAVPLPPAPRAAEDKLVALAGRLLPDGGMPGQTEEERIVRSLILLVALLVFGNTMQTGPFRVHVSKLVTFLRQAPAIPEPRRQGTERLLVKAEAGESLTMPDPDKALRLLELPKGVGWETWEVFSRNVAGLI